MSDTTIDATGLKRKSSLTKSPMKHLRLRRAAKKWGTTRLPALFSIIARFELTRRSRHRPTGRLRGAWTRV